MVEPSPREHIALYCAYSPEQLAELMERLARTMDKVERCDFVLTEEARKFGVDIRGFDPPAKPS